MDAHGHKYLFVYGTLRRGFNGDMAKRLARESEWIGPAILDNAEMFRVSGDDFDYPALVWQQNSGNNLTAQNGDNQKCFGDVFRLFDVEKTLAWLDDYEEFGPEYPQPNEYVRNNVQVQVKMMENGNGNGVEGNPTTTVPMSMPTMLMAILLCLEQASEGCPGQIGSSNYCPNPKW